MKTLSMAAVALAAVTAFGLTGCGGGGDSSGVPTAGKTPPKDVQDQMVKYAHCLEQHGLRGKLPPRQSGENVKATGPADPKVQAAQAACAHLVPKLEGEDKISSALQDHALKMAECLRKQGIAAKDPATGTADVTIDQGTPVSEQKLVQAYATCNKEVPAPN
ncbi:hypothetical protein AGRA3207_002316 [Actinomadura graeca]|uniref:Secreted protein n=1 Tax=Actinomadura graeca TaxID=2750812 RepID=A0ABX8QVJ9_9ACTN|nr:hypothetical protein [Actinomadura graeca]QXJ21462.1 hypothetical protein AGRA3207_002316 [Actinomadura graeca]